MSGGLHETTVNHLCIGRPVGAEEFCGMHCEMIQNMAGALRGREEYAMNMDEVY